MPSQITPRDLAPVTQDIHRYVSSRPGGGWILNRGQAVELAIDAAAWQDDTRPFVFVSQPGDSNTEVIVKATPSMTV